MNTEKQRAAEIVAAIQAAGFRPFLAEAGNYGFYTDAEGTRVVCFQVNGMAESVSGTYVTDRPKQCGTGWRISDDFRADMVADYFARPAPRWAVGSAKWRHTTLREHLNTYQASSRYVEQIPGADYEQRVRALEAEGMTRSDAQAVADAELLP